MSDKHYPSVLITMEEFAAMVELSRRQIDRFL